MPVSSDQAIILLTVAENLDHRFAIFEADIFEFEEEPF